MRNLFAILVLYCSFATVWAQQTTDKKLPDGARLLIEYSRAGVLKGFSNTPAWNNIVREEAMLKRSPNGEMVEIKGVSGFGFVVFLPSYFSHPITQNSAQAKPTTDRPANSLLIKGEKWEGKMQVVAGASVTWCNDMVIRSDAKFEVLDDVDFNLKIKGNDQVLKATPVLETGSWTRCYSARRTPRLLWNKELDMPLRLEWTNWSIDKGLSQTAFMVEIKSIE